MSTLQVGARAPSFTLPDVDGKTYALDASSSPLSLAIFFKTTCPTCHYAWKYYQRLHEAYSSNGLRTFGISQHEAKKTREYRDEYRATFPHLIDAELEASRAYDPDFVPTAFLIDRDGKIVEILPSWNSNGLNKFSEEIAKRLGVEAQTIVRPEDHAVPSKVG